MSCAMEVADFRAQDENHARLIAVAQRFLVCSALTLISLSHALEMM